MNLYEVNAPELLPYIEGYAHTGNWNSAEELTMKAIGLSSRMDAHLMQHLGADSCQILCRKIRQMPLRASPLRLLMSTSPAN